MRRITIAAVGAFVALGLAACSGSGAGSTDDESGAAADPGDLTVGVAMPTQTSERWIDDGDNVKKELEELGYKVDLQYAENDIPTQAAADRPDDHQGRQAADHRLDRRHRAHHPAAGRRRQRTSRSSPTTG